MDSAGPVVELRDGVMVVTAVVGFSAKEGVEDNNRENIH